MKNVKTNTKKVFLMVALLATVMGYANDALFSITKDASKRTVLTLADVSVGNLFTIKDKNGLVLYKEAIQETGIYQKGFDLTALPDGSYFFELDKDMEVTTIPFTVNASEVTFNKANSETVFKPYTRVEDDLILINQLSLNKAPLEVHIYGEGGRYNNTFQLIHSEILNSKDTFIKKVYKITDFKEGNYKIVYKTEGKTFVEFI